MPPRTTRTSARSGRRRARWYFRLDRAGPSPYPAGKRSTARSSRAAAKTEGMAARIRVVDHQVSPSIAARPLVGAILLALIVSFAPQIAAPARAATLPAGFSESVAFSGLTNPTVVRFSPDGRIFVAEKSGLIKVFDSLADTTPTTFADLRTAGLQLLGSRPARDGAAPLLPDRPERLRALRARRRDRRNGAALRHAGCHIRPVPDARRARPGTGASSAAASRASWRTGNQAGPEQPLIDDWCQQYPSHSVGALAVRSRWRALRRAPATVRRFTFADYGQDGAPRQPVRRPAGRVRAPRCRRRPPRAARCAARTCAPPATRRRSTARSSASTPTPARRWPATRSSAAATPTPAASIAHGLRNPFRFAFRPGTSEIYVGDVGWNVWEEINRIPNPSDATVENFGWPCYEGGARQSVVRRRQPQHLREPLRRRTGAITAPTFAYDHAAKVVTGEACPTGSSSISGVAFYAGGDYPASYDGGMFFADYSRDCIWFVPAGAGGQPNFAQRADLRRRRRRTR